MNKNSVRKPVIYGLTHNGGFFYVGRTRTNLQERFWQHSYRARSGHTAPVYAYMREVGISNIEPVELEEISDWESSASLEAEWISKLIDDGHALTNQLGRNGVPDSWSEDMKAKMSIIQSGRETWIKGKRGDEAGWTDERKAAQSARRKGDYKHGARSAAIVHKCTCDECELFRISYYSGIEERKAKNTHGTVAAYKHGKCRCAECRAAYSEYQKRFYTPKARQ